MIRPKPLREQGESLIRYLHRVNEWEDEVKPLMGKEARAIDRFARGAKIVNNASVTKQAQQDRRSIHELAQDGSITVEMAKRIAKRLSGRGIYE